MHCKGCGKFFQPTPDEEHLITTGVLEMRCVQCEKEAWKERVAQESVPPPVMPGRIRIKNDGSILCRADWFLPDERVVVYMALPPLPVNDLRDAALKVIRRDTLRTFVITEKQYTSNRQPSEPRFEMRTNLARVLDKSGTDKFLWVQKIPDYADGLTGVGRIELPRKWIGEVVRAERETMISLGDRGKLRLQYR